MASLNTWASGPRGVVFTCMFGHSEHFNDFHYEADGLDFICFTDNPELQSSFWKMQFVDCGLIDPTRRSKQIKALAHRYLPQYDMSLYLDNTVRLKASPRDMLERFLLPASSPYACFDHPWRNCIYDEAKAVISAQYDNPERVQRQVDFYRSLGYPEDNGLTKTTVLLRRHNDPRLTHVMERWHEQVLLYSLRDQISLHPTLWMEKFEVSIIPEDFSKFELFEWPVVKDDIRIPRDFDDALYRALNPDVTIDSRKHYLHYGSAEKRRYK